MAKRRRKVRLLIDERDFDEAEAQLERWKASGEDAGGLRELQAYLEANASWWTESNTGMKFRRIPGGSFRMGSPSSEEGRGSNERQHTVSVGKFWMGVNEVTLGQFRRFVRDSGHRPKSESKGCFWYTGSKWEKSKNKNWRSPGFSQLDSQPVVCVSWFDASAYAKWLTKKTGKHFRLPTEAEWEYAARAGTQTARYWGEAIGRNRANCYECGSRWDGKQTAPAGSSPPPTPSGFTTCWATCWSGRVQPLLQATMAANKSVQFPPADTPFAGVRGSTARGTCVPPTGAAACRVSGTPASDFV